MPTLINKNNLSPNNKEEIRKSINRFADDLDYFESRQQELVSKYNNEWIAVYHAEVVTHSKKYHELLNELSRIGLEEEQVVVKFLSDSEMIALFSTQ